MWPLTDYPESHFAPGEVHLPGEASSEGPSANLEPLTIEAVRPYRKGYLASFAGVSDRTGAEQLRDLYLYRLFTQIDELQEDEVFYHELLGAEVMTMDGSVLGAVAEVYPIRPDDLLKVVGPDGELLVPFNRRIVTDFDREQRRITVELPEGLLAP